jgi:hypothetical protein
MMLLPRFFVDSTLCELVLDQIFMRGERDDRPLSNGDRDLCLPYISDIAREQTGHRGGLIGVDWDLESVCQLQHVAYGMAIGSKPNF